MKRILEAPQVRGYHCILWGQTFSFLNGLLHSISLFYWGGGEEQRVITLIAIILLFMFFWTGGHFCSSLSCKLNFNVRSSMVLHHPSPES